MSTEPAAAHAFELTTALHLSVSGVGVEFHDFEGGGGFDFLATGEASAEVECKWLSADLGRQICQRDFRNLGTHLREVLQQAFQTEPNVHVAITVPKRLGSSEAERYSIEACVKKALSSSERYAASPYCRVKVEDISIDIPIVTTLFEQRARTEVAQRAAEEALGLPDDHVLLHVRPEARQLN